MDNNNPFFKFIDYVNLDGQLTSTRKAFENNTLTLDRLQLEHDERKIIFERLRTQVHDLRKQIDEKELELKILRDRERTKRDHLESVSSPKEYTSLNNELANLERTKREHEDAIIELWQQREQTEAALAEQQKLYEQYTNDVEQQKIKLASEHEQLKVQRDSLIHHLEETAKQVYPPLLEQYISMKGTVPNPAVPVIDGACSACFYVITANDLTAIKRHKLVQCKECYRILFSNA